MVLLPVQVPADVPFQGIILSPFLTSPGFVGVSLLLWGATLMCLRVLLRCCMIQLRNSSPKNGGGVSRVVSLLSANQTGVVFFSPSSSCGGTVLFLSPALCCFQHCSHLPTPFCVLFPASPPPLGAWQDGHEGTGLL